MAYKLVQNWSKEREKFLNETVSKDLRKIGCGLQPRFKEIEMYVVQWVKENRSLSLAVTNHLMAAEIMRTFPDRFNSFEHCHKWTYGMMERNGLSIRRKTHDQSRFHG